MSGLGASQASSSAGSSQNIPDAQNNEQNSRNFECNICLDAASDAVISMCGHLFCWSCLYQWMRTQPNQSLCPVCKASISREKVIPLYGRGNTEQKDPRDSTPTPPRPSGQRSAPNSSSGMGSNGLFGSAFGGDNGIRMSFGIGAFPFSLFSTSFNMPGFGNENGNIWGDVPTTNATNRTETNAPNLAQSDDSQFLSNLFLCIAVICIVWLLLI